jgi:hypothetical protein
MGKDISHMPAASLGHYAALSFVVIGRRRNWKLRDLGLQILVYFRHFRHFLFRHFSSFLPGGNCEDDR